MPGAINNSNANRGSTDNSIMSLADHIEELRVRLVLALAGLVVMLIICLFFAKPIIMLLQKPYVNVMGKAAHLQTLAPTEGIASYMKISLVAGLILSSPWVFYHLWVFVAAGLYPHEKRYVYLAAPFSAVLFIMGALFFMIVAAPLSLRFCVKVNDWLGLTSAWTFPRYISFMTSLMLVFGIAFQTPTAIFFLNKAGLVSLEALRKSRKYVLLSIVVVSAMVTPPDVFSQIALAIPLYLLFELGILISFMSIYSCKTRT